MEEGLADDVRITYSPGAGGLIGLAQFVEGRRGDPRSILVSGMFTVGAGMPNRANVSLLDATPIARLTETGATIVVPATSPIRSMEELILIFESQPDSILWIGGSTGGPDQMLLQSIAAALRVDSSHLHYRAYPGGADVGAALVAGEAAIGISDYTELEHLVEAGHLRALAMSTEQRLPGIPIPTLKEVGIDISLGNWRAVFAPPGISMEEKNRLIAIFDAMSGSEDWRDTLARYHWSSAFLPGDAFERFVRSQYEIVRVMPDVSAAVPPPTGGYLFRIAWRRYWWAVIFAFLVLAYTTRALYQRRHAGRHVLELEEALGVATDDAERKARKLEEALQGRMQRVNQDFDKWGLSAAERDIALFLLKGLRLQDIADIRATSERTVRQQAQSIYRKSGLESRTELSAYFMEDFMHAMEIAERDTR
jgi:putative tricarboxylic transport membrane protein